MARKTAIDSRVIGKRKTPPTFGVAKQKTLPTFDVDGQEVDSCFKKTNLSVTGFSIITPETKVRIYTQAEALGRELACHMMQAAAATNDNFKNHGSLESLETSNRGILVA